MGRKANKVNFLKSRLKACAASVWEFDRIYYYLVQEKSDSADPRQLLESLEEEFENLRAVDGGSSLIPLHYVIRALQCVIARSVARNALVELSARIESTLTRIEQYLLECELDKGHQVQENIQDFRSYLKNTTLDRAEQPLSEKG